MGCYEYGASPDADGDLLPDADEAVGGTNPGLDDTDGDGLRDGLEVLRGTSAVHPTPPESVHVSAGLPSIQQALCLGIPGDEIVVAPGTYFGNLQFCGADVTLRGSDPRDPGVVASTILDGQLAGSVVTFSGREKETCVLSGFTIRKGKAQFGGGVRGNNTRATIQSNTITANSADSGGGLCGCDGTIQGNAITASSADSGGGLHGCDGTIQGNAITANSADSGGGLHYCGGTVRNNTIAGNRADSGGGLCYCGGTIQNNAITGNSADRWGGGLHYCGGTVRNNTIAGNRADSGGGLGFCTGTMANCVIWGNTASSAGPQLGSSATPTFCCIQDWAGGGEGNVSSDPQFVAPGRWDDAGTPDDPDDDIWVEGDYHLLPGSPCIDAGKNESWMRDAVDIDGEPRIGGTSGIVDMGADEVHCMLSQTNSMEWDVLLDLVGQNAVSLNGTVSGELEGTFELSELWIVTVKSGPFAGQGFFRGEWSATLDSIVCSGVWEGACSFNSSERKFSLRGRLTGAGDSGVAEVFLSESTPETGVYDRLKGTWTFGCLGGQIVSVTLTLDGELSYQEPRPEHSAQVRVVQVCGGGRSGAALRTR